MAETLAALEDDLSLFPSIYMVTQKKKKRLQCLFLSSMDIACKWCTDIHSGKIFIH